MPRISDEQIEHLKQTTDLVAVIKERGVKLRKRGKQYNGCCPFHEGKTPLLYRDARRGVMALFWL